MKTKIFEIRLEVTARNEGELPDDATIRDNLSDVLQDIRRITVDEDEEHDVLVFCDMHSARVLR